jgi:hypothetical protein
MNQHVIDKFSWNKDDLNYLFGFSILPYILSEEIQSKYSWIKRLWDNIREVYWKNYLQELHEIRDILYLLPERIGPILDIAEKGWSVMTFTQLVREAYAEILGSQYSFSSRILPLWSQWKDAWIERREFEPDKQERISFDRFSNPRREPKVFHWLDTSKLSED